MCPLPFPHPAADPVGLDALRAATRGDPRIRVALLDGPVDLSHPCFRGARLQVVDPLGRGTAAAGASHGTHVASVIFGQPGTAVEGLAPGCTGIVIPVFGRDRDGTLLPCSQLDLARALLLAAEHGADIVNISGGEPDLSGDPAPLLAEAVRACSDRGVLIVAAAGNDGCACLHVPAAHPAVLAVGAMDARGRPLPFSNWGAGYSGHGILGPGENVLGAVPGGGTATRTSTSHATAVVAGTAALLLSVQAAGGGPADAAAVREALLATARGCGEADRVENCTHLLRGRLDAAAALARLAPPAPARRDGSAPPAGPGPDPAHEAAINEAAYRLPYELALAASSSPVTITPSVKLTPGRLRLNRYFASPGGPVGTRLQVTWDEVADRLQLPPACTARAAEVRERWGGISSLGAAEEDGHVEYRVYAGADRPTCREAEPEAGEAQVAVAVALGWISGGGCAPLKEYRVRHPLTPEEAGAQVRAVLACGGGACAPVAAACAALLERAGGRLHLLHVTERGGARVSLDFGLPPEAALTMDQVRRETEALGAAFSLTAEFATWLRSAAGERLVRVAVGMDAASRPFVSLYLGERAGPPPFTAAEAVAAPSPDALAAPLTRRPMDTPTLLTLPARGIAPSCGGSEDCSCGGGGGGGSGRGGMGGSGCGCRSAGTNGCGCATASPPHAVRGGPGQLVYALGEVSYDFGTETRRDSLVQQSGMNLDTPENLLQHLERAPSDAAHLHWTLSLDGTPIYALRPEGPFAHVAYERLRDLLRAQVHEGAQRVCVPGMLRGSTRLLSGHMLPTVAPEPRGMFAWSTGALLDAVLGPAPDPGAEGEYDVHRAGVTNFLERVYYELRNLGVLGSDRAINFAATNAFQAQSVFRAAAADELVLDCIRSERSPLCRPDAECWDVKLVFFDPRNLHERARRVYRFTVDVSDVVPVTIGPLRSWALA